MKRTLIISVLAFFLPFLLSGQKHSDPSYRYYATAGLVNITEIHYGSGTRIAELDTESQNSYIGFTNVIGYQANRNFFGGIGVGWFQYDRGPLFLVYMEYKYSLYLRGLTPYIYVDGGGLMSFSDFKLESKIFMNPGIGVSKSISSHVELNISAGYSIQSRTSITSVEYVNFKVGIIYRKNPYRMLKAKKNNYY